MQLQNVLQKSCPKLINQHKQTQQLASKCKFSHSMIYHCGATRLSINKHDGIFQRKIGECRHAAALITQDRKSVV